MIDARETIELYKNRLIELIDNGMIIGSYQIREESSDDQQDNSEVITFYINDIVTKTELTLTLRLGNHHPRLWNYVIHGNIPPHLTKNTSIEFYEPKYKEDGTLVRNRFDNRIRDKQGTIQPFSVTVFEYKPKLLEHDDVETIYNAILSYIENGNYTDPFANTPKRAWEKTKTSQIKEVQKSPSDEKTNESTRINNTRKIYKTNMTHIKRIDEMNNNHPYSYGSLKNEDFIKGLAEYIKECDSFYNDTADEIAMNIIADFRDDKGSKIPRDAKGCIGYISSHVENILEPYNGSTEEDFNRMVDLITMWVYKNIL